jgi:hypothetical protein
VYVPGLEPCLSESRINEVYVALRDLLKAKFITSSTKEQAVRVLETLNKEARTEAIRTTEKLDDKAA